MQQIIKHTSPLEQLFKAVNFAFMDIFDFLVKIAILSKYSNKPRIDEKSVFLSPNIPSEYLLSLLGK